MSPVALLTRDALSEVLEERPPDPLERLLDPAFTETLWEYEESQTGLEIPGSLHAKQTEALDRDDRHKWLFWGNQVGKTCWGAVNLALWALGRHPHQPWEPPLTMWASALTWELWQDIVLPGAADVDPEMAGSSGRRRHHQQSPNRHILDSRRQRDAEQNHRQGSGSGAGHLPERPDSCFLDGRGTPAIDLGRGAASARAFRWRDDRYDDSIIGLDMGLRRDL